jgi:hypothetical protein
MPKRPGRVLSRLENFAKGAKRLLEHLSPRKTRKRPKIDAFDDSGQEAVSITTLFSRENPNTVPEYKPQTVSGVNSAIRSERGRIFLTTR